MLPLRFVVCMLFAVLVAPFASAQSPAPATADPRAVLAGAKAATGGGAWDAMRTQHSKLTLSVGGMAGNVERWTDIPTGRSQLRYQLGPIEGALGFDGTTAWSQDASGRSRNENTENARQLAVNAAYRDQLAFWYPERHAALMVLRERAKKDGATFDVVAITPEGGREFEFWINTSTRMIERLVEKEAAQARTEIYMDLRDVQGVKVPYRVRTNRGDPRYDEVIVVDLLEYNVVLAGVPFTRPAPPKPDFSFPAGREYVELPFEVMNGHLYVQALFNGQGPFRMLFDTGSGNLLLPETVAKLVRKAGGSNAGPNDNGVVEVEQFQLGALVLSNQSFTAVDLNDYARRVEGLDDIAGIIGNELFRRFPIKLDFERSVAIIFDPATFKYSGKGTRVPITFKGNIPQARGSVDGFAGLFDIDTGSRTSLVLSAPFSATNKLAAKYGSATDVIAGAGAGGTSRAWLARAGLLKLGDVEVPRPVTFLSKATSGPLADPGLGGNVGYGVLRRFNLTFDYANDAIYFEPNANNAQADVYDRAGMWIERIDAGFRIVDVVAGSASARAELKAGDVIVAVDGKPWGSTSLSALRNLLRAPPDTKVRLKLADGSEHIVTLAEIV